MAGDSTGIGLQISTGLSVTAAFLRTARRPEAPSSARSGSLHAIVITSIPTTSQRAQTPAWRHGNGRGNELQTGPPVDGITHHPTLTEARQLQAEQIVPQLRSAPLHDVQAVKLPISSLYRPFSTL